MSGHSAAFSFISSLAKPRRNLGEIGAKSNENRNPALSLVEPANFQAKSDGSSNENAGFQTSFDFVQVSPLFRSDFVGDGIKEKSRCK